MIRLAHVWSSDLGIPAGMPFCAPLLERGWKITLITPDGPQVANALNAGMDWLPLALERRLNVASDAHGAAQLWSYFAPGKFDIVHTHNIKTGHVARVVATARRVPILVHTIHGLAYGVDSPPLRRRAHALMERVASWGCDAILAQGQEDRDTVVATGAVDAARVTMIGNGINLSRFDPATIDRAAARASLGLRDDDVLFLSAGRLIIEKGFVELFAAARAARKIDPRIRLAVAGPEDVRADALDAQALAEARRHGVLLLGQRADMPALYAAADAVVLASWHEGMPRVLIEGAAMAKPLLASDVRGCREVVGRDGILVPVRDAAALTGAMLRLAREPASRARLGAAARARALREYDIARVAERVIAVYDELVARKL